MHDRNRPARHGRARLVGNDYGGEKAVVGQVCAAFAITGEPARLDSSAGWRISSITSLPPGWTAVGSHAYTGQGDTTAASFSMHRTANGMLVGREVVACGSPESLAVLPLTRAPVMETSDTGTDSLK